MRIQTNIIAANVYRQLGTNGSKRSKSLEKLSSGYRINRAADDAAGLAISEKMRAQIRGLEQGSRNTQDAVNLIQTSEGGMSGIVDILQRQRELIVQALSDTNEQSDKAAIQIELDALNSEINDLANKTKFNGIQLLNVPDSGLPPSNSVPVIVPPNDNDFPVGYFEVKEGDSFKINLSDIINTGASFPDLILVAPNGDKFGYLQTHLSSSSPVSISNGQSGMSAAGNVDYSGWAASAEWFEVTAITSQGAGRWEIIIDNSGSLPSSFTVNNNPHKITLYGQSTGGEDNPLWIQTGANEKDGIYIRRFDCRTPALGIDKICTDPRNLANQSLIDINNAINTLSTYRATEGAYQNRLEFAMANADNAQENLLAAESRIRDADIAKEMTTYVKSDILSQAATAMLAQANALPQGVLQLLG